MSDLPTEAQGGGSAFADFLSRVRPYPPPPGFWTAVLYALGGALGLLIAGILAAALPTTEALREHVALGADEVGSVLEVFRAAAPAFFVAAAMGGGAVAVIASRRRLGNAAGGILATLPMMALVALAWGVIGWVLVFAAMLLTLVLMLLLFALVAVAGIRLLLGDFGGGLLLMIVVLAGASWLSTLDGDPSLAENPPQAQAGGSSPPTGAASEGEERSKPRRPLRHPALTQRRIALEARINAEYAGWKEVPFVGPCGREDRQLELGLLHEQFAAMKRQLRYAEREGQRGWFDRAVHNLEQVTEERERALADPGWSYQQYERCPSGVGAMPYFW
jgi:hypothetical protein